MIDRARSAAHGARPAVIGKFVGYATFRGSQLRNFPTGIYVLRIPGSDGLTAPTGVREIAGTNTRRRPRRKILFNPAVRKTLARTEVPRCLTLGTCSYRVSLINVVVYRSNVERGRCFSFSPATRGCPEAAAGRGAGRGGRKRKYPKTSLVQYRAPRFFNLKLLIAFSLEPDR